MFSSYHFKLRYSIEREEKLAQKKEDAERNATIQIKLEREEQARLKAEHELHYSKVSFDQFCKRFVYPKHQPCRRFVESEKTI